MTYSLLFILLQVDMFNTARTIKKEKDELALTQKVAAVAETAGATIRFSASEAAQTVKLPARGIAHNLSTVADLRGDLLDGFLRVRTNTKVSVRTRMLKPSKQHIIMNSSFSLMLLPDLYLDVGQILSR